MRFFFWDASAGGSFAGCLGGSFLTGSFVDVFAGGLLSVDALVFGAALDDLEEVGFSVEVGAFFGAGVDFWALLCAGDALVFLGPSLGAFFFGVSDILVTGPTENKNINLLLWCLRVLSPDSSAFVWTLERVARVAGARDVTSRFTSRVALLFQSLLDWAMTASDPQHHYHTRPPPQDPNHGDDDVLAVNIRAHQFV